MMLSLDTAYRSFGGEVEALSTPTICRLPDSRRHQLSAIAREAGGKIIRKWAKLPKDKRQSMEGISEFARTAAQQNENAFVRSRRDPYQKIMGWLLPRAHL